MKHLFLLCAVALAAIAVGCDSGVVAEDGGSELDAARSDGGPGRDSGPRVDSGPRDSGPGDDAGPLDSGPPDSGPAEPCGSPGAIETVACGMCGTVERFCSADRTWAYGVCAGEGECAPGSTSEGACGRCGTQARRCTATCTWETTGTCTGEGECAPGTRTRSAVGCPAGQTREVLCGDACTYAPASECSSDGCPTPGTLETVPCGTMCGHQERFCNVSRVWEYGACGGEGVCVPGTTGSASCGMCGTQTTRCTDACAWVPFGTCTGEGTCSPGTQQRTSAGCPAGQTRLLECGATCGFTVEVEPCRSTVPIDVLFLPDATGSNWYDFQDQSASFVPRCVDALLAIPDVTVGLAYYGDFGSPPETFRAGVELGRTTSAAISAGIAGMGQIGGGDDSTMEALHILTGGTPQPGAIPFVCSAGRVAGGCWRPGARRVIVMHTDEFAKGGPSASGGIYSPWPTGPNWSTVLPSLTRDGALLFIIVDDDYTSTGDPLGQYRRMVTDLGQPATDVYLEGSTEPGLPPICDSIVARIRALTGT